MVPSLKYALSCFIFTLMWCCIARQRRYWRELTSNTPSGSVRAGYTIAFLSIGGGLGIALFYNTPAMWNVFVSIVAMAFLFCLKVTFSPSMIALTLAICTVQLHTNDSFPIMEVWGAFIRVLTWRLPEGVRACYAYISFAWALFVLLVPARAADIATDNALDGAVEPQLDGFDAIHI